MLPYDDYSYNAPHFELECLSTPHTCISHACPPYPLQRKHLAHLFWHCTTLRTPRKPPSAVHFSLYPNHGPCCRGTLPNLGATTREACLLMCPLFVSSFLLFSPPHHRQAPSNPALPQRMSHPTTP